ncbi:MAG: hypothetical protein GX638_14530 [Crenarchaeota archaeon]|nr:hypothetical protein [Thermoproteota archaeon]
MTLTSLTTKILLYTTEGVGVVFLALFSIVYLAGLPTDKVYHSEPFFRTPLSILGITLIILVLVTIIIALLSKKSNKKI